MMDDINSNETEMTDDERFVWKQIQFVRQGSFIKVLRGQRTMDRLRQLTAVESAWVSATSMAIVAETNDQVGLYESVEPWASYETGEQQLRHLEKEVRNPTGDQKADRNRARARAMLVLQCCVKLMRRVSDRTRARGLLTQAIDLISKSAGEALKSQHIESLFYFWLGRTYSLEYDFEKAVLHFQIALDVADRNLKTKLRDVEHLDKDRRAEQVAAGNYVLSTILGFGLGQLRQLEGRLQDSLQFLRVAVPLSRGSEDYHRRGFAHLLIGTALRSQGQDADIISAVAHLLEAKMLLGGDSKLGLSDQEVPPHHLHLARVDHQLALLSYDQRESSGDPQAALEGAKKLNERAQEESNHRSCRNYRDPVLDYGILVVKSLIGTALGEYDTASGDAQEAIAIIEKDQVPRWISGWAWLAKGRALAENIRDRNQLAEIRGAEAAFDQVPANDAHLRKTDRAAAILYSSLLYSEKAGDTYTASVYFDRAKPLFQNSEHRWLKTLADKAEKALWSDRGFTCTFDIEKLLHEGKTNKPKQPWSYVTEHINRKVRDKLLLLKRGDLEPGPESKDETDRVTKVAEQLGIGRATFYKWVRDSEFPEEFKSARRRGRKKR
jgi:tetratricopeptide (TPR) repeat protein